MNKIDNQEINFFFEKSKKIDFLTMYYIEEGSKKYMMSKYNPIKEAEDIINKYEANKKTLWVVLGYGLGYIPQRLIETYGANNILIIEPNEATFQEQIELNKNTDISGQSAKIFAGDRLEDLEQILKL